MTSKGSDKIEQPTGHIEDGARIQHRSGTPVPTTYMKSRSQQMRACDFDATAKSTHRIIDLGYVVRKVQRTQKWQRGRTVHRELHHDDARHYSHM